VSINFKDILKNICFIFTLFKYLELNPIEAKISQQVGEFLHCKKLHPSLNIHSSNSSAHFKCYHPAKALTLNYKIIIISL